MTTSAEIAAHPEHAAEANARMVTKLFFRLLPVQIMRAVVGAVNSLVVAFFTSNFISSIALSAWALFGPIDLLMGALATVLVAGSQVICGRYMGRNEEDGMQAIFALDVAVSLLIGVVLNAVLLLAGLFDLTAPFVADTAVRSEFNTLLTGISFVMVPFILGQQFYAFLSLEQQNKRATLASLATIAATVASCFFLIVVADLGALGLGLSPSVSNWIVLILLGSYFTTEKATMRLGFKGIDFSHLKEVILIGLPAALMPAYQTLRGIIVNGIIMAYVGAVGLSAFAASNSLLNLFWAIPAGMQAVCRILFSMYVGEEDRRSLVDTMRVNVFRCIPLMCVVVAGIIALAHPLTLIFFRDQADPVFEMTVHAFRILPLCMPLSTFCMGFTAYGQAADKHVLLHVDTVFDGVICVAGFSALLIPLMGIDGLYWANVLNGVVCVSIFFIYAAIVGKRFPRTMEQLMVVPEGFGAPDCNRLDISVHTVDEAVRASKEVHNFCIEHGVGSQKAYFSALCMEEMAVNVIEHGFVKDSKRHSADIRVVYADDDLILRIKDDCVPFDPDTRRKLFDPDDPIKNIGVHLVYKIADEIEYRHTLGMNVLTMHIAHEKR